MKIVFFGTDTMKNAAIRYRLLFFAEWLEKEGHTCITCLPSSIELFERLWSRGNRLTKLLYLMLVFMRRCFQIRHVIGADVVFFRGPVFGYGPTFFERIIHFFNPRMVYDIDDAVWEKPAYVTSPFLFLQDFDWIWKMCRMCAHGIVGNEYLREHVEKSNPKVSVVPTSIEMMRHQAKMYPHRATSEPVILGWTGLHNNLGYFEVIEEVLRELSAKYNIVLSVSSNRPFELEGVKVINHLWTLEHEIDYLTEADIGLMPLTSSKRALGKCSFKALQFMGVGTPCVISPVGMNAEVIEDGVTGFLAETPDEWRAKLELLIRDSALRERMGRAARQVVIQRYSLDASYPKFKKVMETVAALRT